MANMAPVFAMKLFPDWNARIDAGRNWSDARPVLGAGKTWRGLVAGSLVAAATALVLALLRTRGARYDDFAMFATGGVQGPLVIGFGFGFGAIVGDAVKSFFKRRTGRQGGAPWVPFDQLDFVVGGLLFAFLAASLLQAVGLTPWNWWVQQFLGSNWPRLVVLLVLTPGLHFLVNIIGYKLKLKNVPW